MYNNKNQETSNQQMQWQRLVFDWVEVLEHFSGSIKSVIVKDDLINEMEE